MRPVLRCALRLTLLTAAATLGPSAASAGWELLGNPVCTAGGDQLGASLAPDGSGGAFVAWLDRRRGYPPNTDLHATRLLADGSIAPGWPPNGAVLSATGLVTVPSLVPDGAGGLMVFWFDQSTDQARMQHVDGSGALAPGFPADGLILPIVVGDRMGHFVRAVADDAGGAYFVWSHFDGFANVLRQTRLTGNGGFAPGWDASGVVQASTDPRTRFSGFTDVLLAADPSGGTHVLAMWFVDDMLEGFYDASLQRTLADGTIGFTASLPPYSVRAPLSMTPDGSGGIFVAWAQWGVPPPRIMQHFFSNGTTAWPSQTSAPASDAALPDGSGGFYLLGRRSSPDRLELHRRQGDGSIPLPWTSDGFIASATGSYDSFAGVRSGDRVYASWSSGPVNAVDLWAVAATPDGRLAPGWEGGGTVVCDAPGDQALTAMMPLGPDDALIAWSDRRSGDDDVYVTLLEPSGPAALGAPNGGAGPTSLAFAGRSSWPNPVRAAARFAFTLPAAGDASLEIVDVCGRVLTRLEPEPRAGLQSLPLDASGLPAGLYWARLRQGEAVAAARFSVVH